MKFVFLTCGLTNYNTMLMPWRYVIEIARGAATAGHKVIVVSDGLTNSRCFLPPLQEVVQVNGPFTAGNAIFRSCIDGFRPDAVFSPIARRNVLSRRFAMADGVPHFGYFPSAWYSKWIFFRICRKLPLRDAVYYGMESLIPGAWLTHALHKKNILGILCISACTSRMLIKSGWPKLKIKVLPPGVENQNPDIKTSIAFSNWRKRLSGKKYILFMGPPKAIRGIYVLLEAFDTAAPQIDDFILVCLIRGGMEDELMAVDRVFHQTYHKGKIFLIKDSMDKPDISAFIASCYAVVLPFLLVPSEIPLTVLEVIALGKPILISETGGTSEYVGDAGMVFPAGNVKALKNALIKVCNDGEFYAKMCQAAIEKGKRQPSWQAVTEEFLRYVVPIASDYKQRLHNR